MPFREPLMPSRIIIYSDILCYITIQLHLSQKSFDDVRRGASGNHGVMVA